MQLSSIETIQSLPISLEKAWDFLSSPGNLKKITPPQMDFRITSGKTDEKMYAGQVISYTIKPLAGVPLTWVTEITHVDAPHYFVDEQRSGPYKFWHHKHFLKEIPGGVEMRDLVHYALPLGFLGSLMNSLTVKNQLKNIFDFRHKKLEELFGKMPG